MEDKEFENKILNTIMVKQQTLINDIFNLINEKYIEKSKVKEKAEELKKNEDCRYCNNACPKYARCMLLQELMGE